MKMKESFAHVLLGSAAFLTANISYSAPLVGKLLLFSSLSLNGLSGTQDYLVKASEDSESVVEYAEHHLHRNLRKNTRFTAAENRKLLDPAPNLILTRAEFENSAQITHHNDYESFGGGFSFPGDPWENDGVVYKTGNNLIVGPQTFYQPISNVFCYNFWTPVQADVLGSAQQLDMIGFDIAIIGRNDPIDVRIITNLDSYEFNDLSLQNWNAGSDFFGFKAPSSGEYITGLYIKSNGSGSAPCIDNVTLGISDSDGDGILNIDDQCPETASGSIVLQDGPSVGCSLEDLIGEECDCYSDDWKNHGGYVRCAAHKLNELVKDGSITSEQKDLLQSQAAETDCGK